MGLSEDSHKHNRAGGYVQNVGGIGGEAWRLLELVSPKDMACIEDLRGTQYGSLFRGLETNAQTARSKIWAHCPLKISRNGITND